MKRHTRFHPFLVASLIGLVTLIPLSAIAAPAGVGGDRGPGNDRGSQGVAMRLLSDPEVQERAGVTDEQVTALEDLMYETRLAMIEHRAEAEVAQIELGRLWQDDEPNADAIHAAIDEVAEFNAERDHLQADTRLTAQSILTAEQRETLQEIARERMAERREQRAERGFGQNSGGNQGPGGERGLRGPNADASDSSQQRGQRFAQRGACQTSAQ